jgi:hypothetical protein
MTLFSSPNKIDNAAASGSPTKAAAGNPTQGKFGKAFSQVRNKTVVSSPTKGKVTNIDVDYEILTPLGACLITFTQHGKSKHAYVYPLLMHLTLNTERVYQTLRVFMQATLFSKDTPDRTLKKSPTSTINVVGLVITFDQQQDHVSETNVGANLLKVVQALVKYANNIAHRPFNGEASETFNYKMEFRVGTDYTRTLPHRRHLGQVISPEDSVIYMERIFEGMSFRDIITDPEIMAAMYGNMEEANALVTIARPGSIPDEDGNEHNHDENLPTFIAEP